jgi:endonuclease/exonuclease/phosphatase family metal-dependent hydrolase
MIETLRVATWNIKHGGGAESGFKAYIGNPQAVGECCAQLEADILALQEVDRYVWRSRFKDLVQLVAEATDMRPYFGKTIGFDIGAAINLGGQYGNALFVRGEMHDVKDVPLDGDHKRLTFRGKRYDTVTEQRGAILARAVVRGQEIEVAATHLGGPETTRYQQLTTAAGKLLSRRSDCYLFMGDLNTGYTTTKEWLEADRFDMTLTPRHGTCRLPNPTRQIDYIAVKGLNVLDSWPVHFPISDHAALVAEVAT